MSFGQGRHGVRELRLFGVCVLLAVPAFAVGRALLLAIQLCHSLFFQHAWSWQPAMDDPGTWAILLVPAAGGLLVGFIARYGHAGVRGHGIPEVIEAIHAKDSVVSPRVALLKPLCAAISIGSGGPFGAEGPVVGLGSSLGSLLGQSLGWDAWERRILLAAGAAAGITAVFGCPVAAVMLAVELLLFEYEAASLIALGLASAVSESLRVAQQGSGALFPMPAIAEPSGATLAAYAALGLPLGLAAALIILAVHRSEQAFKGVPLPWAPALGGLAVGAIALKVPAILGPGYSSMAQMLNGALGLQALLAYSACRTLAWLIALGSGTTGGTLAPVLSIGGGLGALLCLGMAQFAPGLGLDPRLGALIGMAALFAGASHAMLASLVMLLEITHQYSATLPLLAACLLATLVCQALLPHSLMTEGPMERGVQLPGWGRRKEDR
jgi:H+/Cl- antiporter ClcA